MPESFIGLPVDGTGKKIRSRQRVVGSDTVQEQYVITTTDRVVQNQVTASTFRTLGNATTAQTLFTLENGAGTGVVLAVRRLACYMDTTAVLAAVVPSLVTSRTTALPSGGTTLGKDVFDTVPPASPATVVARGATASPGGAATAITATASGDVWEAFGQRMHTLVGQVLTDSIPCLPELVNGSPLLIRPGQAIMVAVRAAATTSNPATNHYVVNAMWEEVTFP